MKKCIAALLLTLTCSYSASAELTDSHYLWIESTAQVVQDNVPCDTDEDAMNKGLKKYQNKKFQDGFKSMSKVLGMSNADRKEAFDYFKDLLAEYVDFCVNGDDSEELPPEENEDI